MGLRKPTNTGSFLNFAAIYPIKWRSGLVFCMLHRAKLICSCDWLFFKEVEILKSLFLSNNYPPQFLHKILRKFLAIRHHPIILKKTKTAINARLAFLKFRIYVLHPNNLQKVCLNLFIGNLV